MYSVVRKGLLHQLNSFISVLPIGDQLRNHGVIEGRDGVVLSDSGFNSDPIGLLWLFEEFQSAVAWQEIVERVFRVNSDLDCIALLGDFFLLLRKWEATGNQKLPFHKVKPSDHLRNGMLNLKSSVHLHEVMLIGIQIENKFDRSSIIVAHSLGSAHSRTTN